MRSARLSGAALTVALVLSCAAPDGATPRFFDDDPLWREPASQDAAKIERYEPDLFFDLVQNLFGRPGDPATNVRAKNVNTVDEVPDGAWFVNRAGTRALTPADVARGANETDGPAPGPWTVIGSKSDGITPGFTIRDTSGAIWFIKFDPSGYSGMATGTEVVVSKLFWALGYHVAEYHLARLDPKNLVVGDGAMITPASGHKRRMEPGDIKELLSQVDRQADGTYRVSASKAAAGKPVGRIAFFGTRSDDPNDLVPHEHRRELRGARVFGAWLNHDDSRGVNSLDMLVTDGARRYVKHYMFDFGSIMGSGTVFAQRHRAGNEYIFEGRPGWLTLATLGLYTRPWMHFDYPPVPPSVGRFEGVSFEPVQWRPEYPNPAFENMRGDDAFWAARIVSRFTDEAIRAVVAKARYSDPRATEYIASTLIMRRDKVLRTWLTGVNPVADVAFNGKDLTFHNAAVEAGLAKAPSGYRVSWARFDNVTRELQPLSDDTVTTTRSAGPADAAGSTGAILRVAIAAVGDVPPAWTKAVHAYFRDTGAGWTLVGFERIPDTPDR